MDAVSEELAQFRERWKLEVRQRVNQTHQNAPSTALLDSKLAELPSDAPVQRVSNTSEQYLRSGHIAEAHGRPPTHFSKVLSSAVETYRLAIQCEQAGDLDEALRLYRNAFRLDSNVDKAYRREEQRLESHATHVHGLHAKENSKPVSLGASEATSTKAISKAKQLVQKRQDAGILVHLISSFPTVLDYEPLDETCPVPFRLVPDEIIILILKALDPHSIERFALLNRKARVLSLEASIWRDLVQRTYKPPQISEDVAIDALAEQYVFDYRRFYIEHPRLRLDGVYIAVCHYVRPGMSADNVWVHVSHLITYHRYLRFFPDGTVVSLLANDDVEPQTVIPLLKPSLRMKGLFIGNWFLEGTTIFIRDLADPSGGNARYTFQMTLTLKSKPLGRWNRLDLAGYDSVKKENGEAIPLALKNERPFWFSKVRSYVV